MTPRFLALVETKNVIVAYRKRCDGNVSDLTKSVKPRPKPCGTPYFKERNSGAFHIYHDVLTPFSKVVLSQRRALPPLPNWVESVLHKME